MPNHESAANSCLVQLALIAGRKRVGLVLVAQEERGWRAIFIRGAHNKRPVAQLDSNRLDARCTTFKASDLPCLHGQCRTFKDVQLADATPVKRAAVRGGEVSVAVHAHDWPEDCRKLRGGNSAVEADPPVGAHGA